jgi:hypothetical protein
MAELATALGIGLADHRLGRKLAGLAKPWADIGCAGLRLGRPCAESAMCWDVCGLDWP